MRPPGTADELERRRRRAVALLDSGEAPNAVARILGVARSTLSRWRAAARNGPAGLAAKPHPGPASHLTAAQFRQLDRLLRQGAEAHGWPNRLWTCARVAALIRRRFGVGYHPDHVRKLLRERLGWSPQKPRRQAREQQPEDVARWRAGLPALVQAARGRCHLVFLDESGFQLTPCVRRTWAPAGVTPVLTSWDRRDRISAVSCVTLSPAGRPNLFFELLPDNRTVKAADVAGFLGRLGRSLRGPMVVVWDRSQVHSRAKAVRAWLARHPEVTVLDLPAYAPALNPDEGVWAWAKYGRLANLAAADTAVLRNWLIEVLVELKHTPDHLRGLLRGAEFPLSAYHL